MITLQPLAQPTEDKMLLLVCLEEKVHSTDKGGMTEECPG